MPDDALDFVVRKAGHMTVFGILGLLIWRALATTSVARPATWAVALTVLYAISDELHQGAIDGRHASAFDVAFDGVGAIVAVVAVGLLRRRRSPE